jgi:hypothetical protein
MRNCWSMSRSQVRESSQWRWQYWVLQYYVHQTCSVFLHCDSSKRCVCPLYKFVYAFKSCKALFETPYTCNYKLQDLIKLRFYWDLLNWSVLTSKYGEGCWYRNSLEFNILCVKSWVDLLYSGHTVVCHLYRSTAKIALTCTYITVRLILSRTLKQEVALVKKWAGYAQHNNKLYFKHHISNATQNTITINYASALRLYH